MRKTSEILEKRTRWCFPCITDLSTFVGIILSTKGTFGTPLAPEEILDSQLVSPFCISCQWNLLLFVSRGNWILVSSLLFCINICYAWNWLTARVFPEPNTFLRASFFLFWKRLMWTALRILIFINQNFSVPHLRFITIKYWNLNTKNVYPSMFERDDNTWRKTRKCIFTVIMLMKLPMKERESEDSQLLIGPNTLEIYWKRNNNIIQLYSLKQCHNKKRKRVKNSYSA